LYEELGERVAVISPTVSKGNDPAGDGVNACTLGWMEERRLGRFNEKTIAIGVSTIRSKTGEDRKFEC